VKSADLTSLFPDKNKFVDEDLVSPEYMQRVLRKSSEAPLRPSLLNSDIMS
jgi:hypothetical protein